MNGDNKRRIDNARDALVGIIPDPKGQVEQITTALMYKFLSEQDAESIKAGGKASYFIGKYGKFSWKNILSPKITGDERAKLYAEALESMGANPKLPDVFQQALKGAHSPFRGAHSRSLNLFLQEINQLNCSHTEDLGDAYEHLLSIMGTQGDAGQFRTPRHIIDFIVEVVNPQIGEKILDPACGSAGFLVSAHKHIVQANTNKKPGDKLTQAQKRNLSGQIEGRDIDPGMARLALVNLFLHSVKTPRIEEFDTLSDDSNWNKKYDVILANPPFMTPTGGIQPHSKFTVSAKRAEVLFVDYIAEHLTPQGRAGIIVPESIIVLNGRAYQKLRKHLVDNWGLYAVVSLPIGVFSPYSDVKTSILFLDKTRREDSSVLFTKVESTGISLGARRTPINENDLPKAVEILKIWDGQKVANSPLTIAAKKSEIAKDGIYHLIGDSFQQSDDHINSKWPMVALGDLLQDQNDRVKTMELPVWSVSNTLGFLQANEYFGHRVASTNISNYKQVLPGYFAYNPARINVGSIAYNRSNESGAVSPMYVIFCVKNKKLNPKYLLSLLKSTSGINVIRQNAHGAIRQQLKFQSLKNIKIPLPPLAEQERIVAEISSYEKTREAALLEAKNTDGKIAQTIAEVWGQKS